MVWNHMRSARHAPAAIAQQRSDRPKRSIDVPETKKRTKLMLLDVD